MKLRLLLLLLLGLHRPPRQVRVTLDFVPLWRGQPFACGRAGEATLENARFFVSDVRLVDARGREVPAELVPDGAWQSGSAALIDFAAATSDCARRGNPRLVVRAPAGDYVRARFAVGVPFALDHANPATATPPLAVGAMSWGWQAGYTFIRVDGARDGEAFRFHLGASECQGTFTHVTRCSRRNVAAVEVAVGTIGVELSRLAGEEGRACIDAAGAGDACGGAFAALGLDRKSGDVIGKGSVFVAR